MTDTPPPRWIAPFLVGLGAAVRLRVYLADFALRHDEAELAINILSRSFRELLRPLDRVQGAPVGFLWVEKAAVTLLGPNEWALRLAPLLASLASLPLFAFAARRLLTSMTSLIALGIFAISNWPIHYGSETKQYSSDLAICLAMIALALATASNGMGDGRDRTESRGDAIGRLVLAAAGAASVWLSHPVLFVLAAIGVWLLFEDRTTPLIRRLARWAPVFGLWAASFAIVYFGFLRTLERNADLLDFWSGAFAPVPPRSMADIRWYGNHALDVLADPIGLPLTGLSALVFVLGCISLFDRQPRSLILLLGPAILTLIASGLGKYPFSGRLILFLVPMGVIVIAEGIDWCERRGGRRLAFVLVSLLFVGPSLDAARYLLRPPPGEELNRTLRAIGREGRPGDPVYVYYAAEPAFTYYTRFARPPILPDSPVILGASGRDDWSVFDAEIARLSGRPRVWVVFSHVVKSNGLDEEKYLLHRLDRLGRRLFTLEGAGASAYLYDLGPAQASAEVRSHAVWVVAATERPNFSIP